jgi:sulfide:quinone oxidoreductase
VSIRIPSDDPVRVVVLGAGFGGLELTTRLADELGEGVDIVLVDRTDSFVFGFSKIDVMIGRHTVAQVQHAYADVVRPGVRFVQAEVEQIDPQARTVETSAGAFAADVLVIALGADLDPAATPGLVEDGHDFYTEAGAFALREALDAFPGGHVMVGVTSTPFKCPPAPSEAVLLLDELLRDRGLREQSRVSLVLPLPSPVPPSPDASDALLAAFAERGIDFHPDAVVRALDPGRHCAVLADGRELEYDLFLAVPTHRAPRVVVDSGLTVDGWIPVDPETLATRWPDVYAVGDVTSVGTPKAGVFAEGQAGVVAEAIIARLRGTSSSATYDGRGICYVEFGASGVAMVDVTFRSGQAPTGALDGPSADLAAVKREFERSRVERWFGGQPV